MEKVAILIPCYNEEKGIGKVLDNIPTERLRQLGLVTQVIVIDNNSTDKTAEVALARNVKLVKENKEGKGYALKAGFNSLKDEVDYVVMLDGDNTYRPGEIPRLIEPLASNFCDAIIGSRLGGKVRKNSLRFRNRAANWVYTFLVRHFYQANITDVLSGYFAWKREVVDKLVPHLESNGFAIEMEMLTKMVKLGFEVYSVPITYDQREGDSKIELMRDGVKIFRMFFKNLFWSRDKSIGKKTKSAADYEVSN